MSLRGAKSAWADGNLVPGRVIPERLSARAEDPQPPVVIVGLDPTIHFQCFGASTNNKCHPGHLSVLSLRGAKSAWADGNPVPFSVVIPGRDPGSSVRL